MRKPKYLKSFITNIVGKYTPLRALKGLNEQDSQDIVQETFAAVFASYHSFQKNSSIKTYIVSIAQNKISDFYRKKYRNNEVGLEEDIESEQETEENVIKKTDIEKQLSKLSEDQNQLLHLIFSQGLSY